MRREIVKTADGSTTLYIPDWEEHYHSTHGAINEAKHVFMKMGLQPKFEDKAVNSINILEVGFGTGLNALLTVMEALKNGVQINYTGLEAYPLTDVEVKSLNYTELLEGFASAKYFQAIHEAPWNEPQAITENFQLFKNQMLLEDFSEKENLDLIYFDAFCARVQPELWSEAIFEKMFQALRLNGTLVTYSAKGSVRRAMQAAGLKVERLPGPPGKREMLRAIKTL
ncbi:MAG: tRNA (5-methylaminomethyl-2-thiouridine)(34)-methyltransferase MnmD [Leeuwenhoekiella sp.]